MAPRPNGSPDPTDDCWSAVNNDTMGRIEDDSSDSAASSTNGSARLVTRRNSRHAGLADHETIAVMRLKLLVFGSLFLSMAVVVLTAYFLLSQSEQKSFEERFYDDANKILSNMGANLERIMEASDAFVVSIASYAAHSQSIWPFVVVPDFAVRAEKVRNLCGAVFVTTCPY